MGSLGQAPTASNVGEKHGLEINRLIAGKKHEP